MKFMSALAMMVVVMMMMMLTKPSDAQMNITAARAHLKEGWWNPNYTRQILEPEERYYFEQVRRIENSRCCFATVIAVDKSLSEITGIK